jgi:hypothetical protein
VFHLPASQEVGAEILFRLCSLNSVWIPVQAFEGEELLYCNKDSVGVLIY